MNTIIKIVSSLFLLLLMQHSLYGQSDTLETPPDKTPYNKLQLSGKVFSFGTIVTYTLRVTYEKTTHLIFPAVVRYVDLGSENLVAG